MKKKFLIILHIYYQELWPILDECLKNIPSTDDYDLFITVTDLNEDITKKILISHPEAHVEECENIGYDVWPFFRIMNRINLNDYNYLVKLHTKRDMKNVISNIDNKYFFKGLSWRNYLLSFICSKGNFSKSIQAFDNNPSLGMINCHRLFDTTRIPSLNSHLSYCIKTAKKILIKAKLKPYPIKSVCYIAGTMFICRASLMKPLQSLFLSKYDFSEANRINEDDLAHVMERVFGWCITSQGYKISDPYTSFLSDLCYFPYCLYCKFLLFKIKHRLFSKICRFCIRIDSTEKKIKIKLFKIISITIKNK